MAFHFRHGFVASRGTERPVTKLLPCPRRLLRETRTTRAPGDRLQHLSATRFPRRGFYFSDEPVHGFDFEREVPSIRLAKTLRARAGLWNRSLHRLCDAIHTRRELACHD